MEKLGSSIGAAYITECDATDEESLDKLFGEIDTKFGGLDIFVHDTNSSNVGRVYIALA